MTQMDLFTDPIGGNGRSPFDAIRQVRTDGTEFWSGRDLMPLLDYEKWERFVDAIERAMLSARSQGAAVEQAFSRSREEGTGGRPREDFHLTRFAAYLVAMNGDPRKSAVAAAQAYFAVKTREAETTALAALPTSYAEALRTLADVVEEREAAERRAAELEEPAGKWHDVVSAVGDFSVGDAANLLRRRGIDTGQNRLFKSLDKLGWTFKRGSSPRRAMQTAVSTGLVVERMLPPQRSPRTRELVHVIPQVRLTSKGIDRLLTELATRPTITFTDGSHALATGPVNERTPNDR